MRIPERPAHTRYIDAIEPSHQGTEGWCGPASLEIAFRALGLHVSQEEIVEDVANVNEGMSWLDMVEQADRHGFAVGLYKGAEYEALVNAFNRCACPIIVAWNSDRDGEPDAHFSVVKHVNGEMIKLADPQFEDYYSLSRPDFEAVWFDAETHHAFMVVMPNPLHSNDYTRTGW